MASDLPVPGADEQWNSALANEIQQINLSRPSGPAAPAPEVISVPGPDGAPVRVARTPGLDWDRVKSIAGSVGRQMAGPMFGAPGMLLGSADLLNNPNVRTLGEGVAEGLTGGLASLGTDVAERAAPNAMAAMHAREAALDAPPAAAPKPGAAPEQLVFAPPPAGAAPPNSPAKGGSRRGGAGPPAVDAEKKQLDAAFNQQQQALQAGTQTGLARAAEEETVARENLASEQRLQAEQLERQRTYKADRDDAMKKLQASYEALSRGPDPDQFWGSRSTGQKVLAGIGMALGAFGAPATGGTNSAVSVINNAIERDIDLQRKNLEAGVSGATSMLGQLRQAFGDDVEAMAATRANTYAIAEAKLKDIAARSASPEMKAKAMGLAGELEQKRFGAWQDVVDRRLERRLKSEQINRMRAEMQPKGMSSEEMRERLIPGIGLALDKEAAKLGREKTGNYQAVKGELQKLIAFRQQYGVEVADRNALAKAKLIAARVQNALRKDDAIGTLDKGAQEMLDRMVAADPGEVGPVLAQLEGLQESIDSSYRARLSPYLDPSASQIPGNTPVARSFRPSR